MKLGGGRGGKEEGREREDREGGRKEEEENREAGQKEGRKREG